MCICLLREIFFEMEVLWNDRGCRCSEPQSTLLGHAFKAISVLLGSACFMPSPHCLSCARCWLLLSHLLCSFVGLGRNFWLASREEAWLCSQSFSLPSWSLSWFFYHILLPLEWGYPTRWYPLGISKLRGRTKPSPKCTLHSLSQIYQPPKREFTVHMSSSTSVSLRLLTSSLRHRLASHPFDPGGNLLSGVYI